MQNTMKVNDQVTVGPQPREEEIQELGREGFRTILNFRVDGEEEQPLSPEVEGKTVKGSGMEYFHLPVSKQSMSPQLVDRFRDAFQQLPKPVFAHCKSGKRAGAMVMMHMAVEQGMSGEETLSKAREMGFECDQPELEQFVKSYVNERTGES